MSRDALILPRKLDWMLSCQLEGLRAIMSDNATFISFPSPGDANNAITIFGDSRFNIQRTIRNVMRLVRITNHEAITH